MPATVQERAFARLYLALPVVIATLSLFWLASGIIALAAPGAAAEVLTSRGVGVGPAMVLVLGGAAVDIGLGLGVLWRRAARASAVGMAIVSVGYMFGAAILAPDLWRDPLGPMVKVLPGLVPRRSFSRSPWRTDDAMSLAFLYLPRSSAPPLLFGTGSWNRLLHGDVEP